MNKLLLLVSAGVGYVLGARAGRERYDQIADQANKLWSDPRVQTKVEEARTGVVAKVEEAKAKAPEVAALVGEQARATAGQVAGQVKSKVTGHETTKLDGSYENETGSIDPTTGPEVDTTGFGPGEGKLP